MNTAQIENLSFAELKARRDELIGSVRAEPGELAARYVQARSDAKQRDEKLAEQGASITKLESDLAAAAQRTDALQSQLRKAGEREAQLVASLRAAAGEVTKLRSQLAARPGPEAVPDKPE